MQFCLPREETLFFAVLDYFRPLFQDLQGNVQIIVHQSVYPLLDLTNISDCIPVLQGDLDKFGLPSKDFLEQLCPQRYLAAVDLNPDFNLYSAFLTLKTEAPKRIGFRSPEADQFFNVQVTPSRSGSVSGSLGQIEKIILPEIGQIRQAS